MVRLCRYSIEPIEIILSKTFLIHNEEAWVKNSNKDTFDVWQGSFDGTELSEPMSIFILSKINKIVHIDNHSLYRDDGLRDVSDKKLEKSFLSSSKIWTLK